MAYSHSKLQALISTLDGSETEWAYRSQDSIATVSGSGYFSDGASPSGKKMRIGDPVHIIVTDSSDVVTARGTRWVSAIDGTTGAVTCAGTLS